MYFVYIVEISYLRCHWQFIDIFGKLILAVLEIEFDNKVDIDKSNELCFGVSI